jgi:hypothetical protein
MAIPASTSAMDVTILAGRINLRKAIGFFKIIFLADDNG